MGYEKTRIDRSEISKLFRGKYTLTQKYKRSLKYVRKLDFFCREHPIVLQNCQTIIKLFVSVKHNKYFIT